MTRAALWVLGAAAAVWGFGRVWPVLWALVWPFAAGGALALLVEGPVQWLCTRGLPRGWAGLTCLVGGAAAVAVAGLWAVGTAWAELWRLRGHLPAILAALAAAVQRLSAGASSGAQGLLPAPLQAALARELSAGYDAAAPLVQQLLTRLQQVLAGLPDAVFGLFVAFATAFFLCRDRAHLAAWIDGRLTTRRARRLRRLLEAARDSAWGMLRAQLLLALATFGISLLGLWAIGAPYVLLASLAAALFDLLPVIGPGLVYVPWIIGAAANHLPAAALALAAVFAAVSIARWLLTPQLLGSQVGLHPFVALAAMFVGAKLAGMAGLLLGPLGAALIQAVWTDQAHPGDGFAADGPRARGASGARRPPGGTAAQAAGSGSAPTAAPGGGLARGRPKPPPTVRRAPRPGRPPSRVGAGPP